MSPKKDTTPSDGFTAEERAAMKERAKEMKAAERISKDRDEGEKAILAKIAEMNLPDRLLAERVHQIITAAAPGLMPRTWYGMPAYTSNGEVVCFFQDAGKFNTRYCTLGFQHAAKLDDGPMWPTAFALLEMTPHEEARITALVKKAAGL